MRIALLLLLGGVALAQDVRDADIESDASRLPKTHTGGDVLLKNATVITLGPSGTIENGCVLVRQGKIAAVGRNIAAPAGVMELDATGRTIIPGIIDCHSHIAVEGGLNESAQSVTPEVCIADVVDANDVAIYRALAGGVTTANILHGSANTIGGQNAVIKLRWGRKGDELLFEGAPRGIKFALGENVKQSNWGERRGKRFPNTRMGVEATLRRALTEAQEYLRTWDAWEKTREGPSPRRDLRLETLAGVLKGDILVHCHGYRADEMLMILEIARDFGFRVATLQHVLEGYKVAHELAAAGTGASTFSDWWGFKIEAYDAIPYNMAIMHAAGVTVSLNSDSDELIRHLYLEAAKAVKYGGVPESDALKMITLNPAIQLGIDRMVGTIEAGKHADLAVFNGHPMSTYSRCVMTLIDGEVYFEESSLPNNATTGFQPAARPRRAPEPPPQERLIAIRNATVHPVSGPSFRKGTVLIRGERIEAVGVDVNIPVGTRELDATGLHVYPGFIDAATTIGITEIGSVQGTRDEAEIGGLQPDLRAAVALNPHSEIIPVARAGGLTMAVTAPTGGLISGRSALVRLCGWVPAEMTVVSPLALHVDVPPIRKPDEPDPKAKEDARPKELKEFFGAARRFQKATDAGLHPERDIRLEAMLPYMRGERPVVFRADDVLDIRWALATSEEFGLKPVIAGGREAWKCASLLAQKKVPVIIGPVGSLPTRRHDPYHAAYTNVLRLQQAGVAFAIASFDATNARNLPYEAGLAASYGLPPEEALKAVTIYPARILGVADRYGSIEPGKAASLIVTTGDPLEIITDIVWLFIDGEAQSLETKHTRLYEKFRRRPRPG
ncbi:MAG: amidohydrolase family protein [Planctomycetes bacterium]|nr:amidohydrolase family protein [Planctomycetota bacterium]